MGRLGGRRARRQEPVQLNLTPMIDVLFNLLIFVLASASIAAAGELPVELPGSSGARPAGADALVVAVSADLALSVGGSPVAFEALEDAVARSLDATAPRSVVIHADRTVPTGVLVDVYDAAERAGAERIAIAAEQAR
jgi:biopolymer transport protein TolR